MSGPTLLLLLGRLAFGQDVGPVLLREVTPAWPAELQARGIGGEALVELSLDAEGRVVGVRLLEATDPTLGLAATEAAWRLGFAPATRDGVPAPSTVRWRASFRLDVVDATGEAALASVIGQLQDPDGLPIPNATLIFSSEAGETRRVPVRPDGSFRASLLSPGAWRVTVEAAFPVADHFALTLQPGDTLSHDFVVRAGAAEEVVIVAGERRWREVERAPLEVIEGTVTEHTLTRRDVESTPGALEDVNRAVQALPGVVSDGDLLATFHARGGRADEVVYSLDGVPLTSAFHLAGFNSLFNPDMVREVRFAAGAAPADRVAGTSAVMDVRSWDGVPDGEGSGVDGAIDVSASSLRAALMGPLDPDGRLTYALAARRSYIESYFAVLKAVNVFDSGVAAPEYGELSARLAWRPTEQHKLRLTALRTADGLALVNSGDDSIVQIDGSYELHNRLYLGALHHDWTPREGLAWRSAVAGMTDASSTVRDIGGQVAEDVVTSRVFARTDAEIQKGRHRLAAGGTATLTRIDVTGSLEDRSELPAYFSGPIADYGLALVEFDARLLQPEAAVYAQDTWEGPVHARGGLRLTRVGWTDEWLLSPRVGFSTPLPTGTVPRFSGGLYHHAPVDPRWLDASFGNPQLKSERALHLVAGVDQALPVGESGGGLARVEVWTIRHDRLVVPAQDDAVYANAGEGASRGLDASAAVRAGRVDALLTYGFLHTLRTTPLGDFAGTVPGPQDQRHTLGATLAWQLGARWKATARYAFHTGRPISTVVVDGPSSVWPTAVNDARLGAYHAVDLRAEWRRAYTRHRLAVYVEVLNVTNNLSDFLPMIAVEEGVRDDGMFTHLPARPFFGVRSDF